MVVIRPVSLDCTIYMLGVFAIEVSRLTGTCMSSLFKTRHNMIQACMFALALKKQHQDGEG